MLCRSLKQVRIDAGRLELERRPVNIKELVRRTVGTVAGKFSEANVALQMHIPDEVGFGLGDAERLEQVLLNLLSNALEFTPAGGEVSVDASLDAGQVLLAVHDTGFGVPLGLDCQP